MNILIKNSKILTPEEIKEGSILIKDDIIVEIGDNISEDNVDKIIDGTGKITLPGLINTHTHLSMALFRGLTDDLALDTWLNDHIWPMEAHLNERNCYVGALLGACELIKSGTTTFSDMYFYMQDVARAVYEAGIRGVLSHGMIDFGIEEKRNQEFIENISLFEDCNGIADGRIKVFFGPHSPYTCSKELLERVREEANTYQTGIHIHVAETKKEINNVIEATGKRPFEYLDEIGLLGPDVVAAHSVWLSDEEIQIIKERGVKISHSPCSNMKLASGISPVAKLLEEGICVSLGTDGASSNNNLDLIEEMKTASLLQKVDTLNPEVLTAEETLKMGTIYGAQALGLDDEIGSIEVGKKADLILIDTNAPNLTPDSASLASNVVYAANGSNVDTTICNGKILMENREILVLDEEKILAEAKKVLEEMKQLRAEASEEENE